MTCRQPPPYLRLVHDPVVDAVESAVSSPDKSAPTDITVRMQSIADATEHVVKGAMSGLMDAALDYGFTDAFGPATRDAIAKIVSGGLEAWAAQYETTVLDGCDPRAGERVKTDRRRLIELLSEHRQ
jgi:hypothetical protein